jgi:hypothetical protein
MSLGSAFLVSLVGSVVGSTETLRRQLLLENVAIVCKVRVCSILHRCVRPKRGSE